MPDRRREDERDRREARSISVGSYRSRVRDGSMRAQRRGPRSPARCTAALYTSPPAHVGRAPTPAVAAPEIRFRAPAAYPRALGPRPSALLGAVAPRPRAPAQFPPIGGLHAVPLAHARGAPGGAVATVAVLAGTGIGVARASDHQDNPLVELNPAMDMTDVYAFPGSSPDRIVLVLNSWAFLTPAQTSGDLVRPEPALPVQGRQHRRRQGRPGHPGDVQGHRREPDRRSPRPDRAAGRSAR